MWLLNAERALTADWGACLTEFRNEHQVARYAILSHTWVDGQEVLMTDLKFWNTSDKLKSGWAKIQHTARIALRQVPPIEWIWIDTCCIDKDSSNELSTAINSMYSWYRNAEICLVYLEDVPAEPEYPAQIERDAIFVSMMQVLEEIDFAGDLDDLGDAGVVSQQGTIDQNTRAVPIKQLLDDYEFRRWCCSLCQSRWFTRGWTLQELVAPRALKFFTGEWEPIAAKSNNYFARLIEHLTGVPYLLLTSGRLDGYSVAEKMSWAANRETTRSEDIAYCLISLFGVSIPLMYGEGPEHAFLRLQQAILERGGDNSMFLWIDREGVSGVYRDLFATHPREFASSSIYSSQAFAGRKYHQAMDMMTIYGGIEFNASLISLQGFHDYSLYSPLLSDKDDALRYIDTDSSLYLLLVASQDESLAPTTDRIAAIIVKRLSRGNSQFTRAFPAWTIHLNIDHSHRQWQDIMIQLRIRVLRDAILLNKHEHERNLQVSLVRFDPRVFRYSAWPQHELVVDRDTARSQCEVMLPCQQVNPRCSQVKIDIDIQSLEADSHIGSCRFNASPHTYVLSFVSANPDDSNSPLSSIVERTLVPQNVSLKRKRSTCSWYNKVECPECRVTIDGNFHLSVEKHHVIIDVPRLYVERVSARERRELRYGPDAAYPNRMWEKRPSELLSAPLEMNPPIRSKL